MVAGIISTAVGGLLFPVGIAIYSRQDQYACDCIGPESCDCGQDDSERTGAILMITGGVLLAGGIPMLVVGARKVPADPAPQSPTATLLLGPAGASLKGRF
jgi:hypothetical protein